MKNQQGVLTELEDTLSFYRRFLANQGVFTKKEEENAFSYFIELKELLNRKLSNSKNRITQNESSFITTSLLLAELKELYSQKTKINKKKVTFFSALEKSLIAIRDEIHDRNLRLVVKIAYKLNKNHSLGIQITELIHEGSMGLIRAMDSFKPELNYKFSTYAYQWIESYIRKAISNYRSIIKVPYHINSIRTKLHSIIIDYKGIHGIQPSYKYLATIIEMPVEKVTEILEIEDFGQPYDVPSPQAKVPFKDTLESQSPPIDSYINREHDKYYLDEALGFLSERQKKVLNMRFGLNRSLGETRNVIANQLSLSNERVRQIENESIKLLKEHLTQIDFMRERTSS